MTYLKFPDYIYAVGGAGKEIILHMLENEWILKEILKPDPNPNFCKIIVVDTAFAEVNLDKQRIIEIKRKKDEIRSEYLHGLTEKQKIYCRIGDLEIDYELITKYMQSPANLVRENVRENILKFTDASCYWLSDENISPDWHLKIVESVNSRNLDFSKGVYRKRAIGKAIYYKALAERAFMVDNHPLSTIAIVCSFGGGTGSGIAIDLAKEIKVNHQTSCITLFGILSTLNEREDEKANCCGMLSELEYINVSDKILDESKVNNGFTIQEKNIFKDIILLPIEATKYTGTQSVDPATSEFLFQFEEAFPYSLIAYYSQSSCQAPCGYTPSFAPFTVAIPQVVRFNINKIRKIKDEIYEKKRCKEASLESEYKIYGMLYDFFNKNFVVKQNQELADIDKLILYDDRYYKYKKILESKYFTELKYNGIFTELEFNNILKLKKILDKINTNFEEELGNKNVYEKVDQLIDTLNHEIIGEGINTTQNPGQTDLDSSLFKMLIDDIEMIRKQIETLRYINSVEDLYVKEVLKSIIRLGEKGLGHRLNIIDCKLGNLENEKNEEEYSKSHVKSFIEFFKYEITISIKSENKNLKDKYREKYSELNSLEDNSNILRDNFATLNQELITFVSDVNRMSKSKVDSINLEPIKGSVKAIESVIAKNNLKLGFNGQEIINTANKIKSLRKAIIDSKIKISVVARLIPGETRSERIKKESMENRKSIMTSLNRNENAKLKVDINHNEEIEIIYTFDIDDKIDELKTEIISEIYSDVEEKFKNADMVLFKELYESLDNPDKRSDINLEDIIKSNAEFDIKISEFEDALTKYDKQILVLNEKINIYKDLKKLVQEVAPYYKKHSESLEKYHSFMLGDGVQESMEISRTNENAKYVYEMQPRDMLQVLALNQDIKKIVENRFDREDLVRNIKSSLDKNVSANYNLFVLNTIENPLRQWNYTKMGFCLISKVNRREITQPVFDHVTNLKANFGISNQTNLDRWILESGDDWGVGLVTFISSVPLDNIRNFVLPNGYLSAYQKRKYSSDKMSFFHSAYMLQNGKLIHRTKIHDVKDKDKDLFLIPPEDQLKLKNLIYKNIEVEELRDYAKRVS